MPTKEADLLYVAKAINDEVTSRLNDRFAASEDQLRARVTKMVSDRFTRVIEGDFAKDLREQLTKSIIQDFNDRLFAEVKTLDAIYARKVQELETVYTKKLEDLESSYASRFAEVQGVYANKLAEVEHKSVERVDLLTKAYGEGLDQVRSLLQAIQLPAPVVSVNVPEQLPPPITVHVPESPPPVVHFAPPEMPVNIHVPEQKAAVVNVQAPEIVFPELKVEIPPARLVVKDITYDDYGRPAHIEEREVEPCQSPPT